MADGAAILGLGITHYPPLAWPDEAMPITGKLLASPRVPEALRDPANWPEAMRAEWSDDAGVAHARQHRDALVAGFRRVRAVLDEFSPDVVVIIGDDQYENFRSDAVPAVAVLAYDDLELHPWAGGDRFGLDVNVWNEPADHAVPVRGARRFGVELAGSLLQQGFDLAYAMEPLHHDGLAHAFANSLLFLDYDRTGFEYPVLPVSVNCYGRRLIAYEGDKPPDEGEVTFAPPSMPPWRLFDFGAALARACGDLGSRVALVASSSWSHAFLCERYHNLWTDLDADRRLYEAITSGAPERWRDVPLDEVEAAGQQELLNWFPLAGVLAELGVGVTWSDFIPSHVCNSNKVFLVSDVWTPAADAVRARG